MSDVEGSASRLVLERVLASTPAFIPYLMAGDPDLPTTRQFVEVVARAGASAIELGVPYSDPLADGPTIAAAGQRALANGVTLREVLELVRSVAKNVPPILLFTYYNPLLQHGLERFARDAAEAGVSGAIVPDLTLEEVEPLRRLLIGQGLVMPLLVAPTTPPSRATEIAEKASGFVYVVSRLGVTGANKAPNVEPIRGRIAQLRKATELPLAVGFGISTAEHVRAVREIVDAVIVGSALIDAYAGASGAEAVRRVEALARSLR